MGVCSSILNTSGVIPINLGVGTHRCKLRDTPAARFSECVVL